MQHLSTASCVLLEEGKMWKKQSERRKSLKSSNSFLKFIYNAQHFKRSSLISDEIILSDCFALLQMARIKVGSVACMHLHQNSLSEIVCVKSKSVINFLFFFFLPPHTFQLLWFSGDPHQIYMRVVSSINPL